MNRNGRVVLAVAIALLLGALAFREGKLAWLALPFLSFLGVGLALAPTSGEIRLVAKRSCREIGKEVAASIEVVAAVRNDGARTVRVLIVDHLLSGATLVEGALSLSETLRPREEAELRYVFEAARGRFEWQKLSVKVTDPFCLFEIDARMEAAAKLIVRPSFRKSQSLPLRLQKTLSSPGSIPIRLGGSGTDFWGIREYRQGDPLKRLYWRLNARNPLRRYTKEFIQERTAEIILVLDGRQRMDVSAGGASLFEREVAAVAGLAGTLIRQGHRVGLFIMGPEPRNVFPDYGRIQLRRILDCLAEAKPQSEKTRESLRLLPTLRYARSAFMMIVSPLDGDDIVVFQRLRALGYQAILISPDTLRFAGSIIGGDPANARAIAACRVERAIALNRIRNLAFPVIDWRVDRELAPLLKETLAHLAPAHRSIGWKL